MAPSKKEPPASEAQAEARPHLRDPRKERSPLLQVATNRSPHPDRIEPPGQLRGQTHHPRRRPGVYESVRKRVENAADAEEIALQRNPRIIDGEGVDPPRKQGRTVRYALANSRILTWSLETHLVDHCNLRCRECCTISPFLAPWFVDPDALARDVATAARVVSPSLFKLTGGEPLLHPRLLDCVDAVRDAGIATQISLTTNGLLLRQAPPELFRRIDRLTVSVYASAPLPAGTLSWVEGRCRENGVLLNVKDVTEFLCMTPETVPQSLEKAKRVFSACWMKERCHLLYRGRFFTCTRPPHLETVYGGTLSALDGVSLDSPDLLEKLTELLEREEPLASCRFCLGTSGAHAEHRQMEGRRTEVGDGTTDS